MYLKLLDFQAIKVLGHLILRNTLNQPQQSALSLKRKGPLKGDLRKTRVVKAKLVKAKLVGPVTQNQRKSAIVKFSKSEKKLALGPRLTLNNNFIFFELLFSLYLGIFMLISVYFYVF